MLKVVLLDASPRHEEATTSAGLAARAAAALPGSLAQAYTLNVRKSLQKGPEADFAKMREADALLLVFPLYFFCLPGLLMRFLQDYTAFCQSRGGQTKQAKVYALVNCGFPEPAINGEAVRVIRCFCRRIGARFRFALLLGGGPMFTAAQGTAPVKKAAAELDAGIARMAGDITGGETEPPEDVQVGVHFPRRLYFIMGGMGWKRQARENGLKPAALYRRPYREG